MSKKVKTTNTEETNVQVVNTVAQDAAEEKMLLELANKLGAVAGLKAISLRGVLTELIAGSEIIQLADGCQVTITYNTQSKQLQMILRAGAEVALDDYTLNFYGNIRRLLNEAQLLRDTGALTAEGQVKVQGPKNSKIIPLAEAIVTMHRSNLAHKVEELKNGIEVRLGHCTYTRV